MRLATARAAAPMAPVRACVSLHRKASTHSRRRHAEANRCLSAKGLM
jgi:hypothetical protein